MIGERQATQKRSISDKEKQQNLQDKNLQAVLDYTKNGFAVIKGSQQECAAELGA